MEKPSIAKVIGTTIGLFPSDVADALNKSGVTVDAQNLPFDKLVDAAIQGLTKSPDFVKRFEALFNANSEVITSKF